MPKWGLSMQEGTLAAWHVAEGDTISPGQDIIDVETDKIANTVEAADGGLLRRRVGEVGQIYPVKALLGVLAPPEVSDDDIDAFVSGFVVPVAEEGEEEQGPAYRFAETPAGRIRYAERAGEGDAIVLVHGFGGDLNNWLFNIDALNDSGPVYALDLPGHGESVKRAEGGLRGLADALAAFMDAAGLQRAHIVGHSLGGAVGAALALQDKSRVRSLTLINSAGLGPEINSAYVDGFVAAQSRRDLKPVLELLFADPALVSRSMIDDLLKFKRLDGVQEALAGLSHTVFGGGKQGNVLADDIAALGIPVLVIWGAKDAIIPVAHANAVKGAAVEIIDSAGHMPQMEASTKVNDLIRAHVRS
jgi:pyruvate dehydrogenase E2 component (dihydrolipoamide acetyltransferase)